MQLLIRGRGFLVFFKNLACLADLCFRDEDLHPSEAVDHDRIDVAADRLLEKLNLDTHGLEVAFEEIGLRASADFSQSLPLEFIQSDLQLREDLTAA